MTSGPLQVTRMFRPWSDESRFGQENFGLLNFRQVFPTVSSTVGRVFSLPPWTGEGQIVDRDCLRKTFMSGSLLRLRESWEQSTSLAFEIKGELEFLSIEFCASGLTSWLTAAGEPRMDTEFVSSWKVGFAWTIIEIAKNRFQNSIFQVIRIARNLWEKFNSMWKKVERQTDLLSGNQFSGNTLLIFDEITDSTHFHRGPWQKLGPRSKRSSYGLYQKKKLAAMAQVRAAENIKEKNNFKFNSRSKSPQNGWLFHRAN